jgi:hypothetical protein
MKRPLVKASRLGRNLYGGKFEEATAVLHSENKLKAKY